MDCRQTLEQLTRELERRGLPRVYIQRLVAEMDDHITDLIEDRRRTMLKDEQARDQGPRLKLVERIGEPEHVAAIAAAEYRNRTFCGRHPILAFVIAPIPVALAAWAAFIMGAIALAGALPWVLGESYSFEGRAATEWPALLIWLAYSVLQTSVVLPPAAATALFCWLARRAELSWKWTAVPIVLLTLLAGAYAVNLELPMQPGKGRLSIGFGISPHMLVERLPQFLLPGVIAALFAVFAWRHKGGYPTDGSSGHDERSLRAAA